MKTNILLITFIFFSVSILAQNQARIIGKWQTENSDAYIEFFQKGDKTFGKIVWLKSPNQPNGNPKLDARNPDPKMKKRPILGLILVADLCYKNGKWCGGRIYSPEKGVYADCEIELLPKNELKMIVSKGVFFSSKIWKRL